VSPRLRVVLLLVGVGTAATLVFFTVARSPDAVRDAVDGFGIAGPLVFVPFTVVNYAAGLTRLPIAIFLAATALGGLVVLRRAGPGRGSSSPAGRSAAPP
jgi:uncharacterized membrane protein YdjX (TVP38/TMEM64 family)